MEKTRLEIGEIYELPNREAKMEVVGLSKVRGVVFFDLLNVDRGGHTYIEITDRIENFPRWGLIKVENDG